MNKELICVCGGSRRKMKAYDVNDIRWDCGDCRICICATINRKWGNERQFVTVSEKSSVFFAKQIRIREISLSAWSSNFTIHQNSQQSRKLNRRFIYLFGCFLCVANEICKTQNKSRFTIFVVLGLCACARTQRNSNELYSVPRKNNDVNSINVNHLKCDMTARVGCVIDTKRLLIGISN